MKENTSKNKTSVGVGTSSILVIFVVLCLVTFAVLSLVSARADKNLSDKAIEHTKEYYEAENNAYFALEQIDKILAGLYAENATTYINAVKENFAQDEDITMEQSGEALSLSYVVCINDTNDLLVELSVDTPKAPRDGFYTIKKWQSISTAQWHGQENLPVLTSKDTNSGK